MSTTQMQTKAAESIAAVAPPNPTSPRPVQQRTDVPVPQNIIDRSDKETVVRCTVTLPEKLVVEYSNQADAAKRPLEKILSDRLRGCIHHTSGRGLYFNDDQRGRLERITGGHIISSTEDALAKIKTVVAVRIADGITIELSERILTRAASRAKSHRMSTEKWLAKELVEGIEKAVGLRPY